MPNDDKQNELTQDQNNPEEMLITMLKEIEQNVMELSQRVDVLEAEENQPETE